MTAPDFAHDLPPRFRGLALDEALARPAPGEAAVGRRGAEGAAAGEAPGRGMYRFGGVGTGKTVAACAAIVRLRRRAEARRAEAERAWMDTADRGGRFSLPRGPRVRFVTDRQLLTELRSTMARDGGSYASVVEKYASVDLLGLDDLASGGDRPVTGWESSALGEIVDEVYQRGTAILATSNRSLGDLVPHLGDRIASRLSELCEVVHLDGADRRIAPTLTAAAWSTGRDGEHRTQDGRTHGTSAGAPPVSGGPSRHAEGVPDTASRSPR